MVNLLAEDIEYSKRFSSKPEISREYIKNAIDFILKKIDTNLENNFLYNFPSSASINNIYEATDNTEWTPGFWTGMLWLAYEVTLDDKYKESAELQLKSYEERLKDKIQTQTHDLGFLYTLSCVAAFKLTGNLNAKNIALDAADKLVERYFPKAGIIQAWGDLNNITQRGRMIIDCSMNLPLLYWAYEVTGNKQYYDIAHNHVTQSAKYIVRHDGSTFHTFYMDVDTGEPKFGKTSQGFSDKSCWSRGQAWGIYGFPLSYIYTWDYNLIETSKCLANYFLNRLPNDNICYWDLIFTDGDEERDSSAAAIAACGLLELSKHITFDDTSKKSYENSALLIIKSLIDNYTTINQENSNGILLHGVYGKPLGNGIDECCIFGDYFYFEALVRIYKDWKPYW